MNIILTGFMGAGKTVVGMKLAEKLGFGFVDLDERISQIAGISISEIFAKDGEDYFRRLESQEVARLAGSDSLVIATGGGVVMDPGNMDILRKLGIIIYLQVSEREILGRMGADMTRPLLQKGDKTARIRELMEFRTPIYEKESDMRVDTNSRTVEEIVGVILDRIDE